MHPGTFLLLLSGGVPSVVILTSSVLFNNSGDFIDSSINRMSRRSISLVGDGNLSFVNGKLSRSSISISNEGSCSFIDHAKFGAVVTYVNAGDFSAFGNSTFIPQNIVFHTFIGNPRGFIQ